VSIDDYHDFTYAADDFDESITYERERAAEQQGTYRTVRTETDAERDERTAAAEQVWRAAQAKKQAATEQRERKQLAELLNKYGAEDQQ